MVLFIGLLTAFLIPFLVIPIYIEYTPIKLPNYIFNGAYTVPLDTGKTPLTLLDYVSIIYFIGVVFFSIRFVIQLISLGSIILQSKRKKHGRYTFVQSSNAVSPFSFFNWIVFNPKTFSESELEQIITHEKIHAKHYHSVDILIAHIACIILWCNPIVWFYNKDLKQNLEFIADEKTQRQFNRKSYQTILLKTSMPTHQLALTNNFYTSLIKKRIVMLHQSRSKKSNQFKYALVIPLLALFLISCNSEIIDKNVDGELNSKPETNMEFKVKATNSKNGEQPLIILDGKEISL